MSISWRELPKALNERLSGMFKKQDLFMEFNPGKCIMTRQFKDLASEILKFDVHKDDVWFISYPKTGSTWCQEMVWLIGNDLNYEKAKAVPQYVRAPVLEMLAFFPDDAKNAFSEDIENSLEWARNQSRPRFIKTHLGIDFLPNQIHTVKPKIVFSIRNTKDVAVSFYHHMCNLHRMNTPFQNYVETFLDGTYPPGSYWEYLANYSKIAGDPNVLILSYEEMKKDFKGMIKKTAKFLEKEISEKQIDDLSDFLCFENMKDNKAVNLAPVLENISKMHNDHSTDFLRKGKVGDWINYLNSDLSERFDELNEKYSKYELVRRANSSV